MVWPSAQLSHSRRAPPGGVSYNEPPMTLNWVMGVVWWIIGEMRVVSGPHLGPQYSIKISHFRRAPPSGASYNGPWKFIG